jgi:hypothetical protein
MDFVDFTLGQIPRHEGQIDFASPGVWAPRVIWAWAWVWAWAAHDAHAALGEGMEFFLRGFTPGRFISVRGCF